MSPPDLDPRRLPAGWRDAIFGFEELARVLRTARRDPGAAAARLERAIGVVRAQILFRHCDCGPLVFVGGPVHVSPRGLIAIGARVQFWPGMMASELLCEEGATLAIGAETSFNYGVTIRATRSVRIGARCLFASMTSVRDSAGERVAPVVIEDDVWVAYGASIEPGVRVGARSVVAAGAVVRRDVPPSCLVVGDPAEIRPLPRAERAANVLGLDRGRGPLLAQG